MNARVLAATAIAAVVLGLAYWGVVSALGITDVPSPVAVVVLVFMVNVASQWAQSVAKQNPGATWRERLMPWPWWAALAGISAMVFPMVVVGSNKDGVRWGIGIGIVCFLACAALAVVTYRRDRN